jgi:hypothetical protein
MTANALCGFTVETGVLSLKSALSFRMDKPDQAVHWVRPPTQKVSIFNYVPLLVSLRRKVGYNKKRRKNLTFIIPIPTISRGQFIGA